MSEKKEVVFNSIEALWIADPKDKRFRPYQIAGVASDGKKFVAYVWERNPTTALGKAFEANGVSAQLIVRAGNTVDEIAGAFATLTDEERAELVKRIEKAPPAPKLDPNTTTTAKPVHPSGKTAETAAKGPKAKAG